MSLANGKVSVCLEVGHSQPFCLAYTKVPVGWLQFPIYLQISTCSHQNSYGRATGSSPFNITVGACSSYSETCHHDPVSLLAMHVSEGTRRIRSLDWQASWSVNNSNWLGLDENWSVCSRYHSQLPIQTALWQLQAHITLHLSDGHFEVVWKPSLGEVNTKTLD